MKTVAITTGIVAVLGATILLTSACDPDFDGAATLELADGDCEVDSSIDGLPIEACETALAPELTVTQKVCTLEARASVLVNVVGQVESHLVPLPADRVFYEHAGSGEQPGVCLNDACSLFAAGFETTGGFEIGAEVCGELLTTRVSVGETSNGCHVDTQHVQLMGDASKCQEPLTLAATPIEPKPQCDREDMPPSALVFPVTDGGDVWLPYPTEALHFLHDGAIHRGDCAQTADNGMCTRWVVNGGLTGRFQAFTETCGIESAVSFSVETSEDGCYPETAFVPLFVDTHGCIRSEWPPEGNPPPETPAISGEIDR
jgi:hypothetical protein